MSISVQFPLDDGFLRRECPNCNDQFKWHHGPTNGRPDDAEDPDVYWCPYCGEAAPPTAWWTEDQLDFAQASMLGPAMDEIAGDLRQATRRTGGLVQFKFIYDDPLPPSALHEPSDMIVVESPCHPWEPIKIIEDWDGPLHCIVCGDAFALG